MGPTTWRGIKEQWSRFGADQSGLTLIYVTIALPVIIGFALLAVDVGRLWSLQSSLQHGADALALAGAGELDFRPNAIERADRAIANLVVSNKSLFGVNTIFIDEANVTSCYLSGIPPSDATAIKPADCLSTAIADIETSSKLARFVQVIVDPQDFTTVFPATFVGAVSNAATVRAEAVAGFQAAVCKFTPVLMCNPFEPPGAVEDIDDVYKDYGLYEHIEQEAFRRKLIALKAHDTQWAPGNFGFLEPYSGPGAKELAYSIASVSPQACFVLDDIALKTEPGNIETLKKAFNVRFSLYPNGNIGGEPAMSYPPAKNVRKGYIVKKKSGGGTADACNPNHNNPVSEYTADGLPDYTVAMGLPKDSCHLSDTCTEANGRMGEGDWGGDNPGGDAIDDNPAVTDFYQYWRFNHPDHAAIPTEEDLDVDVDGDGIIEATPVANDNPPSRYSVYRYEIAQGWHNDLNANDPATPPINLPEREVQPQCNAANAIDSPDRRIIYGALINCRANGLDGGKTRGLRALAFGKFFMTAPMDGSTSSDTVLWTELIDVVQPGDANAVARDIVQLYR